MTRDSMVAVIGGLFGIAVAAIGPLATGWVRKFANGRVQSAKERAQFYRDLQARLSYIENELDESNAINLSLRQEVAELQVDAARVALIIDDLAELRAQLESHLKSHPQLDLLMNIIKRMETRTRASMRVGA